jgi:hypothetical protein
MAQKAYVEQREVVKLARTGLALLDRISIEGPGKTGKKSRKTQEAKAKAKKAKAKAKEAEGQPKEAGGATKAPKDPVKAIYLADLVKANQGPAISKGAMNAAGSQMFAFYNNLLSPESKYAWNKIVAEQMESDPYVNLQGFTVAGPRGLSHKLFSNCMIFHLFTVFPINAAEQEKYYITNVPKKPQRINMHQFVRQVEQLNAYIAQMPYFYYSPNANASTKPKNVSFTKAELGTHVLRMCPL